MRSKSLLGSIMNKVVYTAIFGDKDEIKTITRSKHCDYVVFTDNPQLHSNDFKVVVCSAPHKDPTRNAKFYKLLPHEVLPNYQYSLWIDGSIEIKDIEVDDLFQQYLEHNDIALHAHPDRNCIYDEADVCSKINKDDPAIIRQQMDQYRLRGYPEASGLVSAGIIFRRHTPAIAQLNQDWWREIELHSRRDQLSFNYVAWKNGVNYFTIKGNIRTKEEEGFKIHPHKQVDFRYW